MSILSTSWMVANVSVSVLAYTILPAQTAISSWRIFLALSTIPAVMVSKKEFWKIFFENFRKFFLKIFWRLFLKTLLKNSGIFFNLPACRWTFGHQSYSNISFILHYFARIANVAGRKRALWWPYFYYGFLLSGKPLESNWKVPSNQ